MDNTNTNATYKTTVAQTKKNYNDEHIRAFISTNKSKIIDIYYIPYMQFLLLSGETVLVSLNSEVFHCDIIFLFH